ncbi:MAG: ATP-binding protein [Thermodesulfobacteriota bacterium]|nr:ATP-binding protein [Thermodesulfobacteriota bacterium]
MAISADMDLVRRRVQEKRGDYARYNFSEIQSNALKTFFDLAQEYNTLQNLYRVCVIVPKEYFNLESKLYLVSPVNNLRLVCASAKDLYLEESDTNAAVRIDNQAYPADNSYVFPIKGNRLLTERLPFYAKDQLIGMLEVYPARGFADQDKFFFQKYANRIGYNINAKIVWQQNIDHIKFINSLVADIEHNVITPNIYYKVFFKNLQKKIAQCQVVENKLRETLSRVLVENRDYPDGILDQLDELTNKMKQDYEQVYQHYRNTSLFLETLFRRGHFERGQWILRKSHINFNRDIITPQLERYQKQLEDRGVEIDNRMGGIPEEDIELTVDAGLIAQVYANLFSNAVKYTQAVIAADGYQVKRLAFGRERITDYFGQGKCGIKFNVFTTGPHLAPEDAARIFDEGYRGANATNQSGTGHGLHFIKSVIEVHGGVVGYEPVSEGNNFYFILPCSNNN